MKTTPLLEALLLLSPNWGPGRFRVFGAYRLFGAYRAHLRADFHLRQVMLLRQVAFLRQAVFLRQAMPLKQVMNKRRSESMLSPRRRPYHHHHPPPTARPKKTGQGLTPSVPAELWFFHPPEWRCHCFNRNYNSIGKRRSQVQSGAGFQCDRRC